jgi:peptidoglycan/xylan/chitin deacetylase (PgdA/CDA1 family)
MISGMKEQKMHYLSISWDDGFQKSSLKTAEIYEKFGLRTEFNIIASANLPGNALPANMHPDACWGAAYGDFGLWNELQERGHVVQPHGYRHANKTELSFNTACDLIMDCLEVMKCELTGFEPAQTIFAFPYNDSTPELEAWLPSVVRAFRTKGPAINSFPTSQTMKLTTGGWEDAEPGLDRCLEELMTLPDGWLIYNAHGLDGEGWGPFRSTYLSRVLEKLVSLPDFKILPAKEVLALATSH